MTGYSEVFEILEMIVKCLKIGCKITGFAVLEVILIYILYRLIKELREAEKEE